MRKFIPWLFLIPVLALLAGLPSQLRGDLPYHISTVSYILSIFGWLFTFCGIFALRRASKFSQLFFVLIALVVVADIGYRFCTVQISPVHLLFDLVIIWVAIGVACSLAKKRHDDAT